MRDTVMYSDRYIRIAKIKTVTLSSDKDTEKMDLSDIAGRDLI